MRSGEFIIVLLMCLPLLPWKQLFSDRIAQALAVALVLAIGVSEHFDSRTYQLDNWIAFNDLQPPRSAITDFGAGKLLQENPEILARHGYTENDIGLLRHWFFVDRNIANPEALNSMLTDLGPISLQSNSLNNAQKALKAFFHPTIFPLLLGAIGLLCVLPNRRLLAVWVLCIAGVVAMGIIGRPGVIRVYLPLVSFLFLAPFLRYGPSSWAPRAHFLHRFEFWRTIASHQHVNTSLQHITILRCVNGIVLAVLLLNAYVTFSDSRTAEKNDEQVRQIFEDFPTGPVVTQGSTFPFETMYPVLKQSDTALAYELFSLGSQTFAPYMRTYVDEFASEGFAGRLTSENGVPVFARPSFFDALTVYCDEHFDGTLETLDQRDFGRARILAQLRCTPSTAQQ
ncbi:hypothetical protein [uncultured Roseibium sp.]|uniref:hypothetical protein n=1 Tax=uncultured Roseibium sp. TaxID=1936171 RepID=UPI002626B4CA|nr:hypothetical protein [uncultured Roseibium sp.]